MSFISKRTSAQFYNESQMTFLVRKECVDIIFKIKRGLYLTVSVCSLSENRLLLACPWGDFWNRLIKMRNREEVLTRLRRSCPLASNIFTNKVSPHFAYLDNERKEGAVVLEMKAPVLTNSISDYLHEAVVKKAIELMNYNLNLYVELEEKCPFSAWKQDLENIL
jgi:hypothetical protein